MNKYEFLEALERNLQDVDFQIRHDALRYYQDLIENGGYDQEATIRNLGAPEVIASRIKAEQVNKAFEEGQFDNGPEVKVPTGQKVDKNLILIIAIVIVIASFSLGGIGGAFGILIGMGAGIFGLLAGLLSFGIISFVHGVNTLLLIENGFDTGNVLIHVGILLVNIALTFLWLALFIAIVKALPLIVKAVIEAVTRFVAWLRRLLS
ncbi:MAG: hypothetical protein PHS94_02670 [Erysipelotrichaceae bacterium]|nr:hypothetical protein [Erysipelotrichaceae bacterium]